MSEFLADPLSRQRDEATPGVIVEILGQNEFMRSARVRCDGESTRVNLAYTPEAVIGDHVLVHAGFAICLVSAEEAGRLQKAIRRLQNERGDVEETTAVNAETDDDDDDDPEFTCLCC